MCYCFVFGGISNFNWCVMVDDGDWFVKVLGNGIEMFIDRVVVLDVLCKVVVVGLGLKVYDDLVYKGVEINDFMFDCCLFIYVDFVCCDKCVVVIVVYCWMYVLFVFGLIKIVFDMIDEYNDQVCSFGGLCFCDVVWIVLND